MESGVKEMSSKAMRLSASIKQTQAAIAGLNKEAQALADKKIPTQEYAEIAEQIRKAEAEFNKLLDKQDRLIATGKNSGTAWDNLQYKIEECGNTIHYAQGEMNELVNSGKAFKLGSFTNDYKKLQSKISGLNTKLAIQKSNGMN